MPEKNEILLYLIEGTLKECRNAKWCFRPSAAILAGGVLDLLFLSMQPRVLQLDNEAERQKEVRTLSWVERCTDCVSLLQAQHPQDGGGQEDIQERVSANPKEQDKIFDRMPCLFIETSKFIMISWKASWWWHKGKGSTPHAPPNAKTIFSIVTV